MSPDADWYSTNDGSGKQVMIFERAGGTRTLKNHYTYIPNDKYLMLALDWLHLQLQWLAGEESRILRWSKPIRQYSLCTARLASIPFFGR